MTETSVAHATGHRASAKPGHRARSSPDSGVPESSMPWIPSFQRYCRCPPRCQPSTSSPNRPLARSTSALVSRSLLSRPSPKFRNSGFPLVLALRQSRLPTHRIPTLPANFPTTISNDTAPRRCLRSTLFCSRHSPSLKAGKYSKSRPSASPAARQETLSSQPFAF